MTPEASLASAPSAAGAPPSSGFYTRRATGLVRGISARDSFVMNVAFINIALGALAFTVAPYAFPGVSLGLSVLFTTLLTIFPTVMYAILAGSMPRSGGDYVFIGRILHPALGFAANFNITVWITFFTGILASWVAGFAASSAALTLGTVLDSHTLVDWSSRLATRNWQFGVGIVTIAIFTTLVATGTRVTFRVLGVIFGAMVVCQLFAVAVMLFHSRADFRHAFGAYGNYGAVIARAHAGGFESSGFSLRHTLGAMPLLFSSLGYGVISAYCSGEVKSASRSSMRSMVGALLFGGAFIGLLGVLAAHTFGGQFLGSLTFLSNTDPSHYPLSAPPFFYLFVSMLTQSPVLLVIISLGFVLAIVANIPPTFLLATRNILAWSFDRTVPARLSEVNARFASPVNATVAVGVFMTLCLAYFVYVPARWTTFVYTAGIGALITFFLVAVCGVVFPWRRPDIYEGSPYRGSLAGIPVITLVSFVAAVFDVVLIVLLLTNDALGSNSTQGVIALPIVFGVGLLIYVVASVVNRRRGIDLAAAQQELPPE
ncbi:MAG TPA: APC family permease [Conexibacter sp.]|nr:APC family permease [Conexibacter sp.]